jgi:hypothetical protein
MHTLSDAFDHLLAELSALDAPELDHATGDVTHHVCLALAFLDNSPAFDGMDDAQRVLAREAFLSVLALGQWLQKLPASAAAATAVGRMLDQLTPHVSRPEHGMRRVLLEGKPLESVPAG